MPAKAQILVVDDDPVIRSLLSGYLSNEGYAISEVASAEAARDLLARQDVDAILLDIRLPGVDGLTLTRELRARSEVGIVLITGSKKDEIDRIIGRRPILAVGNSDGDLEMLAATTDGEGPRFAAIVHHTDGEREWAYDRESHVGRLDRALDAAAARSWTVVDMRRDWRVVYPFER